MRRVLEAVPVPLAYSPRTHSRAHSRSLAMLLALWYNSVSVSLNVLEFQDMLLNK